MLLLHMEKGVFLSVAKTVIGWLLLSHYTVPTLQPFAWYHLVIFPYTTPRNTRKTLKSIFIYSTE